MLVNRLAGLVLPASSKFLIDDVLPQGRGDLLRQLALAVRLATLVQAATSFALSQVLSIAAQRAITDMRKSVQAHVLRLPVRYFDSTKTGVLISRIMTDAEGIRNLVGTGHRAARRRPGHGRRSRWACSSGSTGSSPLITLVILASFGAVMAFAFSRLRPIFRERGAINAEVTGRLAETLGGVRAGQDVHRRAARAARLRARRAPAVPQRGGDDHRDLGGDGGHDRHRRHRRRADDRGGRPRDPRAAR